MTDGFDRKQQLLEGEVQRYLGETCPALVARWQAAITGLLAPPLLRDLAGRLQELDAGDKSALRAALLPVAEGGSTEPVTTRRSHRLSTSTRSPGQ